MLTVRLDSEEPLADQILRGIRSAIASGELPPGAELPPVRQLAVDL
ncbi:MAG TPA: GntR family transcriptional regulator, partial [Planctomycetota bacterium]|nr:GntR family transcriptional regulator [Planctomycetota bacterium]